MAGIFSFKCSSCDKIHEGSPSFGFNAPDPYLQQPKEVQDAGELTGNTCQYKDEEGEHYFIRVCLEVPIHGVSEPFLWGVWVSLSQRNFNRYLVTFDSPDTNDCYFGWLCNYLPYYPNTFALKTQVHPSIGNIHPSIELEQTNHPLAIDFHEGISIQKAQEIATQIMHR
ncbi:MAG: hypothetical protein CTY18_07100 [Methylomonas sp.]|nr:MAG: hypothetical protein CTY24_14555 [Methylobacter sp.]PPD35260.1 MAG: hypothetical protein CTY18_07100 [Methylomonas sp.]